VPSGGADAPLSEVAARAPIAAPSQRQMVALIGPTGVGKTTTIAKLAARSALIEKRSVAIVTLDTYRVGGEEQLRAFADLMGVPLTLVSDADQVAPTLRRLAGAHDRIYIDTAGRSPRDVDAIAQLERAFTGIPDLEMHLVVSASAHAALVDNWMQHYRSVGIDRLLFTKIDEAPDLTELVRTPARLGRPISFITNGQRVPEDLEVASDQRLLDLATRGFAPSEVAA
jgi:flagellar biosynthesis protein FlhF